MNSFRGTYALSETPNREILYVMNRFGFPPAPYLNDVFQRYNLSSKMDINDMCDAFLFRSDPSICVGIVDHNQRTQSPAWKYNIPRERVVGTLPLSFPVALLIFVLQTHALNLAHTLSHPLLFPFSLLNFCQIITYIPLTPFNLSHPHSHALSNLIQDRRLPLSGHESVPPL